MPGQHFRPFLNVDRSVVCVLFLAFEQTKLKKTEMIKVFILEKWNLPVNSGKLNVTLAYIR